MREPLKDKGRLEHILSSIERIERFTAGMTFEDLRKDEVTYYAVVKCIEIIGEASYITGLPVCPRQNCRRFA